MAEAVYTWKQPAPKLPGVDGGTAPIKSATDPMAAPSQAQPTTTTAAPATPSFGELFKSPTGASPTPSFNDLFQGVGEQRQQNVQAASQNIAQGFGPAAPSTSGEQARNAFLKSQDETQRQMLEQATLAGRGETGQIIGDNRDFLTQQAQPARMDFEAQLQTQEADQARQRSQDAFGNLLAMEGLGEQGRATNAANALAARGQDITARGQDIQERMGAADIASREKLGFADLNVREKELSQAGQQFKDELAFKRFATEGGWSQQEADRVWKSMESEKDRSLTQSESALDRELNKYIADSGFDIDRQQLSETIRQFDSKLAFDQWATQAGLDDNEKARVWEGHLQDLNQKWQTGERLGSQEHQILIEDKRAQVQRAAQEFERLTNLEVLGKTQDWERAQAEILNGYQVARDQGQMSHEQAMQAAKGEIETRLTQMGIDAQTARQAADIASREWEVERQIAQETTLANAELLYKYDSLRQQAGISEQELDIKRTEIQNQVSQFADSLGLDKQRLEAMLKSEESKADWDQQAILMELAGDDPDMVKFASHQFVNLLGRSFNLSPEEQQQMHDDIEYEPPPTTTAAPRVDATKTAQATTGRTVR